MEELEKQRALNKSLKQIIWLSPFFGAAFMLLAILGGVGGLEVVAFTMILVGTFLTAWGSGRWEHRWEG